MFSVALMFPLMSASVNSTYAQQPHTFSVTTNKDFAHLKPGETATVDINIQKQNPNDKIEMMIKSTPLTVRTEEDTTDQNSMTHHATLYVTAPINAQYKSYNIVLKTSDGHNKTQKNKMSFVVGDTDNDSSVNFYISSAYTTADFDFHLGGLGFTDTPKVIINGKDISDKIVSASDTDVNMKGVSLEDLNLIQLDYKPYTNDVIIVVGNKVSNNIRLTIGPRYSE